ncbi:hypothetical protein PPERSA_01710 [Pseudocohnilembus persalinus]|uniref:GAF domain-containing protein n=1 Tax=Pseudocohnilembus persalinus TaxID=266149 RepID=A0A0V0R1Y2_PSEPJ|nr:hypothetical protein PPERSA_01710 [Pseudocohnilembus persalinus]|eukprot:KRX08165.1 hypothetical protein PPERSA_01710 [Pseudocohnilembus persalinus]
MSQNSLKYPQIQDRSLNNSQNIINNQQELMNSQASYINQSYLKQQQQLFLQQQQSRNGLFTQGSQSIINQNSKTLNDPENYASSQFMHGSKIPAVTEIINLKFKPEQKELHKNLIEMVKNFQNLENIVKYKNREIEKLHHLINYLQNGLQKRDEILANIQEENRKLKEQFVQQEMEIKNLKFQLKYTNKDENIFKKSAKNTGVFKQKFRIKQEEEEMKKVQQKLKFMEKEKQSVDKSLLRPKDYSVTEDKAFCVMNKDLNLDVNKEYFGKPHINYFQEKLRDEQFFIDKIQEMDYEQSIQLYDNTLRLQSSVSMSQQMVLTDALELIVEQGCEIIECDRCSVFIYDQESEKLWTKVAKGSQKTIRIPYNQGVAGLVFTSGKGVNILNAYRDERFNKEVDKITHYKTNTILCYPIFDQNGQTVNGVLQCVNKCKGYFTQDDQQLIQVICQVASMTLRNAKQFDDNILVHNNLRQALKSGILLNGKLDEVDLLLEGEKQLRENFNVQKVKIYYIDDEEQQFYTYNIAKEKNCFPITLGLAGDALKWGDIIHVNNAYNHPSFNVKIDIDTAMPVIVLPVKREKGDKIQAILEIINQRGITGIASEQKLDIDGVDLEALDFFSKQFCQALINARTFQKNRNNYLEKLQNIQDNY